MRSATTLILLAAVLALGSFIWLVERRADTTDRRAEVLSLTPRGSEVFAELGSLAVSFDRQLRDMLGRKEADRLTALLRRLVAASPRPDAAAD